MIRFRSVSQILFAGLLSACAHPMLRELPVESTQPGTLTVASWNLEHLAEANGTGCRPRADADYAELRRHAEALDADVIAFQEVETRKAAERVFDPSRYDVVISNRPDSGRSGACGGGVGGTIRKQDVGFAIRKGVRWTRNPDVDALGLGNPDLRWGVDVTIRRGAPIRLLAVHLKSGCSGGDAGSSCSTLFAQTPVLQKWIDARARAGGAYAVLGDWNRRLALSGDTVFARLDKVGTGSDLTLADAGRNARCQARYRDFIDHIATGPTATARIVPGSFREYDYGTPENLHPSDHCPISVRFTTK